MNRYFIYLSYNGKNYCGWQNQPNGISVQEKLEEALSMYLREKIQITGAGRTDAGVHALYMVAHFDWEKGELEGTRLTEKLNRILPQDIVIDKIIPVRSDAHARFNATSRTYQYFLSIQKNPFRHEYTYKIHDNLNLETMNLAASILFEYTDFTSFSKLHTDVKTNHCKIMKAHWEKSGDEYIFTIKADRFLRNMVRAIVGTLLETGRGKLSIEEFRQVIEAKDRSKAGSSVPGNALFLTDVSYPENIFQTNFNS